MLLLILKKNGYCWEWVAVIYVNCYVHLYYIRKPYFCFLFVLLNNHPVFYTNGAELRIELPHNSPIKY